MTEAARLAASPIKQSRSHASNTEPATSIPDIPDEGADKAMESTTERDTKTMFVDGPKSPIFSDRSRDSGSTVSLEGETEEDKAERKAKKVKKLEKEWQTKVETRHSDYLFSILYEVVPKQILAAKEQHQAWVEVQGIVAELEDKIRET